MNAQESFRPPDIYSKTEVDLKLQILQQQIDAKLDKLISEALGTKLFLYAAVLPIMLAMLAIIVSIFFKLH